jgi:lysophospholipase L1-like esterase
MQILRKAIGPAALTFGTLIFLEVALRVALPFAPSLDRAISPHRQRISHWIADPTFGVRPNPDFPGHDARGFRNETALTQADIVFLGDSQTYGSGVSAPAAWPSLIRDQVDVPVYSMAFGGFGPVETLSLIDSALALQPKVVVEALYAGNDLWDCFESVYLLNQHPHLRADDDSLVAAMLELESELSIASEAATLKGDDTRKTQSDEPAPVALRHRIKIYLVYREAKKRIQAALREPPSQDALWLGRVAYANALSDYCEVFEMDDCRTLFTPRYRDLSLDRSDPRIADGYRIALAAIEEIRDRVEQRGARFVLVLIPTKEFVFRERVHMSEFAASDHYLRQIENETEMWQDFKAAFDQMAIEYIDTSESLAKSLADGAAPYRQSQDGHPNETGHKVLADLVLRSLGTQP